MPDLTIEYYWECEHLAEWQRFAGYEYDGDPVCDWTNFHDEEPVEDDAGVKRCPRCGAKAVPYQVGV